MYCKLCDKLVQVDFFTIDEWDEIDEHHYGDKEYVGDYAPQRAGETIEINDMDWDIHVKVKYCANCGHTLEVKTYARPQ
jgi:uncharacterized protein YlaI